MNLLQDLEITEADFRYAVEKKSEMLSRLLKVLNERCQVSC